MAQIIDFSSLRPRTNVTLITASGFFTGTVVSTEDGLVEIEDAFFIPNANPVIRFPLRHMMLRDDQIIGYSDPFAPDI